MIEGKARAREDEVIFQILQRRYETLEAIRVYEEFREKKISPSNEWPRLIVCIKALFRELEPYIRQKGERYDELEKQLKNCKTYEQAEELVKALNLFCYDLGILKIDYYREPKIKKLED